MNIAFTYQGFEVLGLKEETLKGFLCEFFEGMDTAHRRCILGDTSPCRTPDSWQWGKARYQPQMHILLMLDADSDANLQSHAALHRSKFASAGLKELVFFPTNDLLDRKEHFGFRDGIGQPEIASISWDDNPPVADDAANAIPAGEVLLGYPNAYGDLPPTPVVRVGDSPFDFGCNGSYMVFRQLQQDVPAFWQFLAAAAKSGQTPANPIELASKMIGRWPVERRWRIPSESIRSLRRQCIPL